MLLYNLTVFKILLPVSRLSPKMIWIYIEILQAHNIVSLHLLSIKFSHNAITRYSIYSLSSYLQHNANLPHQLRSVELSSLTWCLVYTLQTYITLL